MAEPAVVDKIVDRSAKGDKNVQIGKGPQNSAPKHGFAANLGAKNSFSQSGTKSHLCYRIQGRFLATVMKAEIRKVDRFIQRNTIEKFGPVIAVTSRQVFKIAFDGIQKLKRHKSGIAVRFPRIVRWRQDKTVEEADSIDTLTALLPKQR